MSAPVKNLLAPTKMSNSDVTNKYVNYYTADIKKISQNAMYMLDNPMFFNQLGTRFAFHTPFVRVDLTSKTNIMTNPVTPIKTLSMQMLTNTFPAVYQPVNLRPVVGQLFPLSGYAPY